jgi:hypothetical protein
VRGRRRGPGIVAKCFATICDVDFLLQNSPVLQRLPAGRLDETSSAALAGVAKPERFCDLPKRFAPAATGALFRSSLGAHG